MKHLFLALMLTIGFDISAQVDGMFAFSIFDKTKNKVFKELSGHPLFF